MVAQSTREISQGNLMAPRRGTRQDDNGDMVDRYEPPPPPVYKKWLKYLTLAGTVATVLVGSIVSIWTSGQSRGAFLQQHETLVEDVSKITLELKEHRTATTASFTVLKDDFVPRPEIVVSIGALDGKIERVLNILAKAPWEND